MRTRDRGGPRGDCVSRHVEVAQRYPTILTIDRSNFRLRLFKRLKLSKTYPIAVGAAGYDTPGGLYAIRNKTVNPAWSAPNRPWAGLYAGTTVPGGAPNNPLKARWLGIYNGVGIHGTGDPASIGTRASHGCIRMTVPAVIDLYPRVPIGAPVTVTWERFKSADGYQSNHTPADATRRPALREMRQSDIPTRF